MADKYILSGKIKFNSKQIQNPCILQGFYCFNIPAGLFKMGQHFQ